MTLGSNQKIVLKAIQHHRWYYKSCGWYFVTHKKTVKILDSLVKKQLVKLGSDPFCGTIYTPT